MLRERKLPLQQRKEFYNYADEYSNVRVYPKRIVKIKKKAKKKNPFVSFIRFCFVSAFLTSFSYFTAPEMYAKYFEPLFLNRILNKEIQADMKDYTSVYLNYLNNSELFGQNLLVETNHSDKNILNSIVENGELTTTKKMVEDLLKKYPKMHASVYVWEYSSAKSISINSDELFSAASIIKLPILFELFRKIDRCEKDETNTTLLSKNLLYDYKNQTSGSGDLQYSPLNKYHSVDYLAKIMITHSDNSATNMILEEAGGKLAVNSAMRSLGLDKIKIEERLPDLEGKNKISARQIATLLYNLDNPKFLSQKSKITIKEYMANVKNRSLLQAGLPEEAILIHKTGDIGTMLGDAGVVYAQNGKKYIIVTLVKRPYNNYSARDLIQKISEIVYKNINNGVDIQ